MAFLITFLKCLGISALVMAILFFFGLVNFLIYENYGALGLLISAFLIASFILAVGLHS